MFFLPCVGLLVVEFPPIASHCPLREGRSGSLGTRGASVGLGCRAEKSESKQVLTRRLKDNMEPPIGAVSGYNDASVLTISDGAGVESRLLKL